MTPSEFIFSDKYKLRRHLTFWAFWWLFCTLLYAFAPGLITVKTKLLVSSSEAAIYMVPHMMLSYSLVYFVIPRLLLKEKYWLSALSVFLIFILTSAVAAVLTITVLTDLRAYLIPPVGNQPYTRTYSQSFFLALLAGFRGAVTIGGMAAAIKLMKHWSLKEQRNLQLQKENFESRLQLLKAQVHPHFLFNTLNNIYSFSHTSPVASRLVMGLSDMLRYMLYECNQPLVPLTKDIRMLKDYIELEKIRYGNKLDVSINIAPEANQFLIAPLLLLPFVENSFKHGASQIIDHPWISLQIDFDTDVMHMKLINAKAENSEPTNASGIGIENVSRRLSLLYPGKHQLKLQDHADIFVVDLMVTLERRPAVSSVSKRLQKLEMHE